MGLRERVTSVQGKALMGSFFAAEMLDTAMTKIELSRLGGTEISPFGGVEFLNTFGQDQALILKTAIITFMISAYAFASLHDRTFKAGSRIGEINPKRATERALQAANVFAWSVVAWNSVNMAPDIIHNIRF